MKGKIKVLIRRACQEPVVEDVDNSLESMQKLVGGYIEMPYNPAFSKGLQIVCNEEGKFAEDPKPNVYWGDYDVIFGDIVFVGINNEGEDISLTSNQIAEAKEWISNNDASEISNSGIDGGDLVNVILDLYSDINKKNNAPEKIIEGGTKNTETEM